MPAGVEINNAMQEFTGHKMETSNQHKESWETRIAKHLNNRKAFGEFRRERDPITEETSLRNIEIRAIADPKVDADGATAIGQKTIEDVEGK